MIKNFAMGFVVSGLFHPLKKLTPNRLMGRIGIKSHIGRWEGDFRGKNEASKKKGNGTEEGEGGLIVFYQLCSDSRHAMAICRQW